MLNCSGVLDEGVTLSGIRAMLVCPTVLLCRRSATVVLVVIVVVV